MNNHDDSGTPTPLFPGPASPLASGVTLIIGTIVAVVFMAIHPSTHAHDVAGFVVELGETAAFNAFVHAVLISASCVVFVGLVGVAQRIGFGLALTRLGLAATAVGTLAGIAAATVNGFILPGAVSHRSGDEAAIIDKLKPIIALCMEANGALARTDVLAMSAGLMFFSITLVHRSGAARWLGGFGLVCALGPAVALLAGQLPMDTHGFGAFVLAQAAWWMTAAVLMLRGKL